MELLGNSLDVSDPKGTLEVNAQKLKVGDKLIATYKNKNGIFEPASITCDSLTLTEDGDSMSTVVETEGTYTLTAGDRSVVIEVVAGPAPAAGTAEA